MPEAYEPTHFWKLALSVHVTMYKMLPRSLMLLPLSAAAALIDHYVPHGPHEGSWQLGSTFVLPLTTLVGLLTAFRLNDALNKWMRAARAISNITLECQFVITRLCAYIKPERPEVQESVIACRRMLILALVLVHKHVMGDDDLEQELQCGLIGKQEAEELSRTSMVSCAAGKSGCFPPRNRPAYAFFKMQQLTTRLARANLLAPAPYHLAIDGAIGRMATQFQECVLLGTTQMPLPYAQVSRFVCLVFLASLPFAIVRSVKWLTIPLCLVANLIYFTIEYTSSQMENPFGDDAHDIDVAKVL
jgi:predicted membrane chloride channel (bestrophin family)